VQDDGRGTHLASGIAFAFTVLAKTEAAAVNSPRIAGKNFAGARKNSHEDLMTDRERTLPTHPIGTLAIVGVYGLLFAAGWLIVYVNVYLSRGAVTP
jgi:hypothetical protein